MAYGKVDVAGNGSLSGNNRLLYNVWWQQGSAAPGVPGAPRPLLAPHPAPAWGGPGPVPGALRHHVNTAVWAQAHTHARMHTPRRLGNPHIWLSRDRAMPGGRGRQGLEDREGQECVSSPEST